MGLAIIVLSTLCLSYFCYRLGVIQGRIEVRTEQLNELDNLIETITRGNKAR